MIPSPPKPIYEPGTVLRVTQKVRVGHRQWTTQVEGVVERDGFRPIGGTEMGGKTIYCHQPTVRLRKLDGEITVVAIDDDSIIEKVGALPSA